MHLENILEEHLDNITEKYGSFVDTICTIIEDKGVSPEALRLYLLNVCAFTNSYNIGLMSDKKHELAKQVSIIDIFNFLSIECSSFLNYGIYEKIMKKYGIKEDREELKYSEHLKDFINRHNISEFVKISPRLNKHMTNTTKLVLKFDIETTCTLAKMSGLEKCIAKILRVDPITLQIVDIDDGCVEVTFLIPVSVAGALFTQDTGLTPEQEDELQATSVVWLKCKSFSVTLTIDSETKG